MLCYDALYRSGWTRDSLKGAEMCASYGYASSEFATNLVLRGVANFGYTEQGWVQSNPSSCASRLHYVFGMKGPVGTTETACSSSLSAVGLMHNNMRPTMPDETKNMVSMRKQVKYGFAIGTNGHFDPFYTIALCGASMLSHVGRCFTFDQSADGFIRGEGCGAMAFRVSGREDVARLAILCGTCLNQDGRSASLTAPHGPSQQECIRHSLREAGIKPLDIQIQELHGTGTALGDPIEVGALRATMMKHEGKTRHHPLVKTSSKSNLGHTEMSAGINGLMKCVLMGIYAASAPNLHLRLLNPHIDDAAYPVHFNPEFVDQGKETGFFGVSSFGFGGSNARARGSATRVKLGSFSPQAVFRCSPLAFSHTFAMQSIFAACLGAALAQLLCLSVPGRAMWAWYSSPPKCKLPAAATWSFDGASTVDAGTADVAVLCTSGTPSMAMVSCPASTGQSGDTWWGTCGSGTSCASDMTIGTDITCSGNATAAGTTTTTMAGTTTMESTTTTMGATTTIVSTVGAAHGYGFSAGLAGLLVAAFS
ncbi:unnamed protein product [Effrenium voratum]|nr:unnamed protein product [Effrenium voratum]